MVQADLNILFKGIDFLKKAGYCSDCIQRDSPNLTLNRNSINQDLLKFNLRLHVFSPAPTLLACSGMFILLRKLLPLAFNDATKVI